MKRKAVHTRMVRGGGFLLWQGFVYHDIQGYLTNFEGETVEVTECVDGLELYSLQGKFLCIACRMKHKPTPCPDCGTELESLYSGVRCPKPECGYWFCF